MKSVAAIVVLSSLPAIVFAQSLGEVATRERARRAALTSAEDSPIPDCSDAAAVEARGNLLREAGDRTIPTPLCGPPLDLPRGLREMVCVALTIDERGEVESATLTKQVSDPALAQLVVEAARRWRYWPAHVDGKPFRTTWTVCFASRRGGLPDHRLRRKSDPDVDDAATGLVG